MSHFQGKSKVIIIPPTTFLNFVSSDCKNSTMAIYGMCRYVPNYTGAIVTIRNEITNISMSFYSSNYTTTLIQNSNNTGLTLASWLGTSNGRISAWYDQSGRGINLIQATNSKQPLILYDNAINSYYVKLTNSYNLSGGNVFPTSTITDMHMVTKSKDVIPSMSYLLTLNGNNTNSPGRFSAHWPYGNMMVGISIQEMLILFEHPQHRLHLLR